jgi:hypothetical protein
MFKPTFINASRARAVVAFAFLSHADRAAVYVTVSGTMPRDRM